MQSKGQTSNMALADILPLLLEEDRLAILIIEEAITKGDPVKAINSARVRLSATLPEHEGRRGILLGALASRLIDAGDHASDASAIEEGIRIIEDPTNKIRDYQTEESVEYNLGNGKYALHLVRAKTANKYCAASIELLTEAKNHHWRALKATEHDGSPPRPELMVNLANTLDSCGRVVEALAWYDRALETSPEHPMASLNRAQCLLFLNSLSDTYTLGMLFEALDGFQQAHASGTLGQTLSTFCNEQSASIRQVLKEQGLSGEEIAKQQREVKSNAGLSSFRRQCVEHHLALSEHALYCACSQTSVDDLSIPKQSGAIGGDFIPKFELYLNRLKSEFALARALYLQPEGLGLNDARFDAAYTDLLGNEANGIGLEGTRTAFRLCFGILDKIARGICDLFGLATDREVLYFDSFWKNPSGKARSGRSRWDEINTLDNIPLVALYSLATDLNLKNGEWADFKNWRNALEHGLLFIGPAENRLHSPLVDEEWARIVTWVEQDLFRQRTLHLLQFTAAAIFSFAFCVRVEGMKRLGDDGVPFTLARTEGSQLINELPRQHHAAPPSPSD